MHELYPLAAKYRHVILHCICLVKPIEHMLMWVQSKWSGAYRIQCPIHLVSIRVPTTVRRRAFQKYVYFYQPFQMFWFQLYKQSRTLVTVNCSEEWVCTVDCKKQMNSDPLSCIPLCTILKVTQSPLPLLLISTNTREVKGVVLAGVSTCSCEDT